MEDEMMVDHTVSFPDIPSDVHMTPDEGAPSVHAQGTMFPEFDGTEWPHHVLSLGEGSDEEEQASTVGIPPPTSDPSGGAPVLQEWIADAPLGPTPAPDVGSNPTPTLIDCIAVQLHETQQVSEQWPGLSSQAQSSMRTQPPCKAKGAKPSGGKSRGIPKLPSNAPPLTALLRFGGNSLTKNRGALTGVKTEYWGHLAGQMTPMQKPIPHLCTMSKGSSSMSVWHQFPRAIGLKMPGCMSWLAYLW
ncbi:hypothetical protein BKA82DRAFT_4357844 [Pisolithus tinctorius]|nr:hypothetical protein BKA82DRAFT_4357844 [Pisolithus tinctorius]